MPPGSGAARSPALSAEGDTVLFHRTLRRVRSEGNAGHGRGEAGTAGPPRAAKLAALPPHSGQRRGSRFPAHAAKRARGGRQGRRTLTVGPASDGGTERQRRVPLPVASSPGMTVKRIAGLASPGELFLAVEYPGGVGGGELDEPG
jgi:hypothetical protein